MSLSPFLQGLARQQLRYQRCQACGHAIPLERHCCPKCRSTALDWQDACGLARVYAVTEVMRAPSEAFRALVPFTIVLATLDEGPLVMGHADAGVAIGDRVVARFKPHDGGVLLHFARAD